MRTTTIAVALLVATPAIAAEFQRYPQSNNRPDHIAVSGGIQTNDEQKFVELTADLKDATIMLNSPGGNLWPSMRIGTVIRERGWETHASFGCNSACAFIWLAGSFRTLGRLVVQGTLPVELTVDLALKYQLPSLSTQKSAVQAGILMIARPEFITRFLETQKLEQLEARMDEIADRVARDRTNACAREDQHP